MQTEAFDQTFQGGREHGLVAGAGIRAIGAGKGDTVAADNGDPTHCIHVKLPVRLNEGALTA